MQEGENERRLRALLVPVLAQHEHIVRSYLARAGFQPGDPTPVILCLIGPGIRGSALLDGDQSAFHTIAPANAFLDLAFLAEAQAWDLARVCAPFHRCPQRTSSAEGVRCEDVPSKRIAPKSPL